MTTVEQLLFRLGIFMCPSQQRPSTESTRITIGNQRKFTYWLSSFLGSLRDAVTAPFCADSLIFTFL